VLHKDEVTVSCNTEYVILGRTESLNYFMQWTNLIYYRTPACYGECRNL